MSDQKTKRINHDDSIELVFLENEKSGAERLTVPLCIEQINLEAGLSIILLRVFISHKRTNFLLQYET